jgi:hypothetical protein
LSLQTRDSMYWVDSTDSLSLPTASCRNRLALCAWRLAVCDLCRIASGAGIFYRHVITQSPGRAIAKLTNRPIDQLTTNTLWHRRLVSR